MRILFTFIGGQGHFRPLVPLARAAEAAGHTVAVAGSGKLQHVITDAGFIALATSEPHPAGVDPRVGERDTETLKPIDRDGDEREFAENFARKGARRHAGALATILADWRPDVVVRDEADFGSAVAAERAGVPCATVLVLASGALLREDLVVPALDEVRAEHGLPPDPGLTMLERGPTLSPFPPELRHPDRPLPANTVAFRAGPQVRVVADRTGPARVYFTLGTVFNAESGDLFERALAGLAEVDARVVVTVGPKLDPAAFGPQRDGVLVERFVDQADLLPTCDLVVSHGGSGSLVGALAHGLPSVLLPMGADQSHNAERAEGLGVARVLDAARATPTEITAAVTDGLADHVGRERARAIQAGINQLPGPDAAVRALEQLSSAANPRTNAT